jgi:transglutaminase-like putative cysteine protease
MMPARVATPHAPWVTMPTAEGTSVRREATFTNLVAKAQWLDAAASLDARNPNVRELAIRFAKSRGANDQPGIVNDIYRFCRDSIPYCYGPSHQEFADTWTILNRPGGACDNCAGKSRAFVALCRAVEIDARIVPNFKDPEEFNHVQAQVRWPGSESDPRAEMGGWLRAELIVKGVPLGYGPEMGEHVNGILQLTGR